MSKSIKKTARNIGIILLISIGCTFYFAGGSSDWLNVSLNILYGVIVGLTIAIGSSLITRFVFKREETYQNPIRYYMITIVLVTVYIFVSMVLVNWSWFYITQGISLGQLLSSPVAFYTIGSELIIGELIYLIALSRYFARDLQKYYKRVSEIESQLSKYRYDTLKNQLNPHFLFNSLNTLSGLIYIDVDRADTFIHRLSNLYRYVLDMQRIEVVPLETEMALVQDFIYLNNIRFSDQIKVMYELDDAQGLVAPMALQLLLENAIKHNEISEKHPLHIRIFADENAVSVQNSIRLKMEKEPSHELGLKNLEERYAVLTDEKVRIDQGDTTFTVSVPLIQNHAE